jgi:hypothetical protein
MPTIEDKGRGALVQVKVNGTNIHGVLLSIFQKVDGKTRVAVESIIYPGFVFVSTLENLTDMCGKVDLLKDDYLKTWEGQKVKKRKGYPYPGICLSSFVLRDGSPMLAVECTLLPGQVQVFGPGQLEFDNGE